ncbi:GGDEF domain-containing protein [Nitrospirillum sp. BR 11828]|uniref:GGDEF domain-containing protein n=1 Tax=Nitrospirillum sp. BR 11828 TaxID=3104325 RepID=UPI002ACADE1C|nr:GGDEF domain-containing protein [Nitrospirillum sp. BR 11828]MDZ5647562.1 GGDEF domain-containing protein [Nitrospirillum sp. BR 11828]
MLFAEGPQAAGQLAQQAMDRMRAEAVAPHPHNFTVWYAYYSGRYPDLTRAVDIIASNGLPFTEARCGDLYHKFFAADGELQAMQEIGDKLTEALAGIATTLSSAGNDAGNFGAALKTFQGQAELSDTLAQLRGIIRVMTEQAQRVAVRNQFLQTQLTDSAHQLENMRRDLDTVRREAMTDALTELANRKQFDQALREAAAAAMEDGRPLCLLMIDIDFFKKFNDNHGHVVGDQVLKLVGRTLKDSVRGRDTAARFGGEEFAIVMPECTLDEALAFAEQTRATIANRRIVKRTSGAPIGNITLSVGVALYELGESLGRFIQRADEALYVAKHEGRNQVRAHVHAGEAAFV